jgi:hypothetical protein
LLPESIEFFAFGVDLLFAELRNVKAVDFRFRGANRLTARRSIRGSGVSSRYTRRQQERCLQKDAMQSHLDEMKMLTSLAGVAETG